MDIRDLLYDVTNFEFTKERIAQTLLDAVAFLPVIGGIKSADEAADVLKAGAKSADEAADVLKAGAKSADEIADAAKTVEKTNRYAHLPKHIHMGNQGKYIIGHNNFDKRKGVITIPIETVEMLIKKYSGTGRYINESKEIVDFEMVIGYYVVEETGESFETTVGSIHYSLKKGAHIVPARPNDWKE